MLELINHYGHGYAAVPVVAACAAHGVFDLLEAGAPVAFSRLCAATGARDGHLRVALNLIEAMGWVDRDGAGDYRTTPAAQDRHLIPPGVTGLLAVDFDAWMTTKAEGNPAARGQTILAPWFERSAGRWGQAEGWLPDFLDGLLVPPLFLALHRRGLVGGAAGPQALQALPPGPRRELRQYFRDRGWIVREGGRSVYSAQARELAARILNSATILSYRPMFQAIDDLIFGSGIARHATAEGDEHHVDRTLNVEGSGFQHQKYFKDLDDIIERIFDDPDLDGQPTHIVDMGCGDGRFLQRIHGIVTGRTRRGRHLDTHPLTLVGADLNRKSLEAAARTLSGIDHLMLTGDIGDPAALMDALYAQGVRHADDVLHVRSFLDHERPFRKPQAAFTGRPARDETVCVDPEGHLLPAADVQQSLVEHLERWAAVLGRHGLLLLEVHCLPPATVRGALQLESLHYDAFHAFSGQLLVEADRFIEAAAAAGLLADPASFRKYPRLMQASRISLGRFTRRPFHIRPARPEDLAALMTLEVQCWPEGLRTPEAVIARRVARHPGDQYVLAAGDRVLAVVYTQPVAGTAALRDAVADRVDELRCDEGAVLQLITLNVDPAAQDQGLGDQLLEFVLQRATLDARIREVAGITRCRGFAAATDPDIGRYLAQRDAAGRPVDPFLRFHGGHGAEVVAAVPGYRPADHESRGYGVLIRYDLASRLIADDVAADEVPPDHEGPATPVPPLNGAAPDRAGIEARLRHLVGMLLGRRRQAAGDMTRPFLQLGLDSADLLELSTLIRDGYGLKLPQTFFFEFNTCDAVAAELARRLATAAGPTPSLPISPPPPISPPLPTSPSALRRPPAPDPTAMPVAVVGMSGRFPGAADPDRLWRQVRAAGDCIGPVPSDRWPAGAALPPEIDPGLRGGFLDGVRAFDAAFFGISAAEAEEMDPQERLFLETVWTLLESAGHPPRLLQARHGGRVGVYAGVMHRQYDTLRRAADPACGLGLSAGAGVANRVSSQFDLHGPSLAVDTMCSSAAVAIHLACADLARGVCDVAIAGGVNLTLDPAKYLGLAAAGLLAGSAADRALGAGSGYLPAEAVGAFLLKPLAAAQADGDQILGVIRASAMRHAGRANGYLTPGFDAQRALFDEVFRTAGVDPRSITHVELAAGGAHLSDAIEIQALAAAFRRWTPEIGFCTLGSVKSVIGHAEAASAVSQLAKGLVQLRARELPPSVSKAGRPAVDLDGTPFRLQTATADWGTAPDTPRRMLINAFGAGGTMAVLLLEEPPAAAAPGPAPEDREPVVLVFSARRREDLAGLLNRMAARLQGPDLPALADLAHTLQCRREPMAVRLALVTDDILAVPAQLAEAAAWLQDPAGPPPDGVAWGDTGQRQGLPRDFTTGGLARSILAAIRATGDLRQLAAFWVAGGEVPWEEMAGDGATRDGRRRLVSLPGHPLAPTEFWPGMAASVPGSATASAVTPVADDILTTALRAVLPAGTPLPPPQAATLAQLGLRSLQIMRLRSRLAQATGRAVPLDMLAPDRQVAAVAADLGTIAAAPLSSASSPSTAPSAAREDDDAPFGTTPLQQAFLVGRRLPGADAGAHLFVEYAVPVLDIHRLRQSFAQLIDRHPMLRAVFRADGRQQILPVEGLVWQIAVRDLRDVPDEAAAIARHREPLAHRIYDPGRWPLFAIQVLKCRTECRIQFGIDELIADGRSLAVLLRDWDRLYAGDVSLPPLPATGFRDWQRACEMRPVAAVPDDWPGLPAAELPLSALSGDAPAARRRLSRRLPPAVWRAFRDRAAAASVSPSALLLTCLTDTLRRAMDQDRFGVLVTRANRSADQPGLDELVGPFVATGLFVTETWDGRPLDRRARADQARLLATLDDTAPDGVTLVRALRRRDRLPPDFAIPVVFTSLLDVFDLDGADRPGRLWADRRVFLNQTPQVRLDHQVLEEAEGVTISWDICTATLGGHDPEALLDRHLMLLTEAAGMAGTAPPPVALMPQQAPYLFARDPRVPGGPRPAVHYLEAALTAPDPLRLARAVAAVVELHPILRMRPAGDGRLEELAAPAPPAPEVVDLTGAGVARAEGPCRIRDRMSGQIFAADGWPFFGVCLSLTGPGRGRLHLCIDMLVADAPSAAIVLGDLVRAHDRPDTALPRPAMHWRDIAAAAVRQAADPAAAACRQHWAGRIAGLPPGPDLTVAEGSMPVAPAFGVFDRWRQVGAVLAGASLTGFAVLLACFCEALATVCGHRGFTIVAVRWARPPGGAGVVGDFSRLSWIVCPEPSPDPLLRARRIQQVLDEDARHDRVSGLDALRRDRDRWRAAAGNPFPVVCTEPFRAPPAAEDGHRDGRTRTPGVALDGVFLDLADGRLSVRWDIDETVCPSGVAARIHALFMHELDKAAGGACRPVAEPETGAADIEAGSTYERALP